MVALCIIARSQSLVAPTDSAQLRDSKLHFNDRQLHESEFRSDYCNCITDFSERMEAICNRDLGDFPLDKQICSNLTSANLMQTSSDHRFYSYRPHEFGGERGMSSNFKCSLPIDYSTVQTDLVYLFVHCAYFTALSIHSITISNKNNVPLDGWQQGAFTLDTLNFAIFNIIGLVLFIL